MRDETRETKREMIDLLQENLPLEITRFEMSEYIRGDPTTDDADVTGAEIELTAYVSYETESDDDNPYRVK